MEEHFSGVRSQRQQAKRGSSTSRAEYRPGARFGLFQLPQAGAEVPPLAAVVHCSYHVYARELPPGGGDGRGGGKGSGGG